jgi:hypothetical protein
MRVSAAILLGLLLASCSPARLPVRRICQDGWPIKILQHPECPRGICGYTCAPDRWRQPHEQAGKVAGKVGPETGSFWGFAGPWGSRA